MLEIFWQISLLFGNAEVMVPLGLTYSLWESKLKPVAWFIFLLSFSLVVNKFLKHMFKVPLLKPDLATYSTYGFPSGHMQMATVFYGWIWCRGFSSCYPAKEGERPRCTILSKLTFILLLSILISIGLSIVRYGFHTWADILAGGFVGSMIVFVSDWIWKKTEV